MGSCYSSKRRPFKIPVEKQISDLNLDSILARLQTQISTNEQQNIKDLRAIEHEINKLRQLQFNYNGFSLTNSDQFIIDVLSFTCFNRDDQFNLMKLYLDASNKRINIDDLFLSCLDAIAPKTTILILNEYLRSCDDSIKDRCKEIDDSTVVDIVLRRFDMFLYGFRCGVHQIFTATHRHDFNDYRILISLLFENNFQLNSRWMTKQDNNAKNYILFQIFLEESCSSSKKTDKLLNDFLDGFLKKLVNFENISWPAFVINNYDFKYDFKYSNEISAELRVKIKCLFYMKLKKSRFVNLNEKNSKLLREIMIKEKVFFQPLELKELSRKNLDVKSQTVLSMNKNFIDFISYKDEPNEAYLLYFI